jgi:hypothetical protein
MSKRTTGLRDALNLAGQGQGSAKLAPARTQRLPPAGARPEVAKPYRAGRVNVTGYFDPAVKQSIRLIQAQHPGRTVQDLLAEALNDLFAKYNVPQAAEL